MKQSLLWLLLLAFAACGQDGPVGLPDSTNVVALARKPGPPPGPPAGPPAAPPPAAVPSTALQIVVTGDGPVNLGDPFGFDISVANVGSETAISVSLSGTLPNVQSPWSVAWTGGSSVTCVQLFCGVIKNIGGQDTFVGPDLAPGEFYSVRASTANSGGFCGTATLTATVAAENAPPVQASASVTVVCPEIQVTVTGIPADRTVQPGEGFWYDITVRNTGSLTALYAWLTVTPPEFTSQWTLDWISGDVSVFCGDTFCGIFVPGPNGEDLVGVDLAPGDAYTVRLATDAYEGTCGTVTATANVSIQNGASAQGSGSVVVICPPQEP